MLAAAGCTPGSASTATVRTASTAVRAVTVAQARQAFDHYVATSEAAARTGDEALALSGVTGAERVLVSDDFRALRAAHQLSFLRFRYNAPALYLTTPAGYPRWFAARVTRDNRPPLPDDPRPMVMLFTQATATAPWLLAGSYYIGASMPEPAVTRDGQTPALAMSQPAGLLVSPDVVGPLLAAVSDQGRSSPAARFVSGDGNTMMMYAVGRSRDGDDMKTPRGDVRQWELDGTGYPQFALRTADGGALVFFAMSLDITVEVPAALNQSGPVSPGPPITAAADVRWLLPAGTPTPRVKLEERILFPFVAVDPPAGGGKIRLVADNGVVDYAAAS